jgi:hypothetical protein
MEEKGYLVWIVWSATGGKAYVYEESGPIRRIDTQEFVSVKGNLFPFCDDWRRTREGAFERAALVIEERGKILLEQAAAIRRKEGLDAVCPSA